MMKKNLIALCLGMLFSSTIAVPVTPFFDDENSLPDNQLCFSFSESLILNSSAFNLHSAILESLLDRESPEYILIS